MAHIVRDIGWGIIDVVEHEARVFYQTVPHEFGHAVGNTWKLSRGDEYKTGSPHLADTDSILNIGRQLRLRHFTTLLEEMNKMIPDTTFAVHYTG